MEAIRFPEQTVVFAEGQEEYKPLPAYLHYDFPGGTMTCCWRLTWYERLKLLFTGKLWHSVMTFGGHLQPQRLDVDKPEMPPHVAHAAHEADAATPCPIHGKADEFNTQGIAILVHGDAAALAQKMADAEAEAQRRADHLRKMN